MPSELKVGQKVPFFVIGTDKDGQRSGTVGAGQTLSVTTESTAVSLVADSAPQPAPDGGPSLASGMLTGEAAGVAILTANLLNADGSVAATAKDSVTVDAVATGPGPATALTLVFGTPV